MVNCWMLRILVLIGTFAVPSTAFASVQVTVGNSYAVSLSGIDGQSCYEPGPFSDAGTMTLVNVSGNIFHANISFSGMSEEPPSSVILNGLSSVFDSIVSGCGLGNCPEDDGFTGGNIDTVSGSISPTSVSVSGSGTDNAPPSCTFTFSLTGAATLVINPETTATAAQTQQADA